MVAMAPAMMGASAADEAGRLLGLGLFAGVALILVAVLAYLLGRLSARTSLASAASTARTTASSPQAEGLPAQRNAPVDQAGGAASTPPLTAQQQSMAEHTATAQVKPARDSGEPADAQATAYTVSHDLRAPLRVVEGFARILKEDYGRQLDRIGNDHLDRVLAASARMNAMIEAMLTMARITSQPLSRQQVNLSQIARFVLEDLQESAPGRALYSDIEDGLMVTADPTLMRQLMENLLSNAWKYTAQVDTAHIRVRSLTDTSGRRVIEVSDNGAGFDMRSAERLFGLFQRLHAAHDFPGTGVGLASVQRIVRRHGGDVWAESAPGQGARFQFTLG